MRSVHYVPYRLCLRLSPRAGLSLPQQRPQEGSRNHPLACPRSGRALRAARGHDKPPPGSPHRPRGMDGRTEVGIAGPVGP